MFVRQTAAAVRYCLLLEIENTFEPNNLMEEKEIERERVKMSVGHFEFLRHELFTFPALNTEWLDKYVEIHCTHILNWFLMGLELIIVERYECMSTPTHEHHTLTFHFTSHRCAHVLVHRIVCIDSKQTSTCDCHSILYYDVFVYNEWICIMFTALVTRCTNPMCSEICDLNNNISESDPDIEEPEFKKKKKRNENE